MTTVARVLRWTEHIVLIVLLLVLLSVIAPFGTMFRAVSSGTPAVSAETVEVDASELSDGLVALLPDIGQIYRTAVAYPLQKARGDITDPELLEFYDGYLQAIGFAPEP